MAIALVAIYVLLCIEGSRAPSAFGHYYSYGSSLECPMTAGMLVRATGRETKAGKQWSLFDPVGHEY